jgi:hypothetical protein
MAVSVVDKQERLFVPSVSAIKRFGMVCYFSISFAVAFRAVSR